MTPALLNAASRRPNSATARAVYFHHSPLVPNSVRVEAGVAPSFRQAMTIE
jgi:hypothetical protein